MIVVDGSIPATGLDDDGSDGDRVRARLRGEQLWAPHLVDLEVGSVWRRLVSAGALDARRAALALQDLESIRLERAPHRPLVARCWELRSNLTFCDAAYVALAELLGVAPLTGDARLASAAGVRCDVELM